MVAAADEGASTLPQPKAVVYHPVTGVPEEFHDFLHKDSDEYKLLQAAKDTAAATGGDDTATAAPVVRTRMAVMRGDVTNMPLTSISLEDYESSATFWGPLSWSA
jgi:hypothetical protein